MSEKIELTDVANLSSETSATTSLNQNFNRIAEAFDNTLSLDGSAPNSMLRPLDMNGYQVINVGAPTGPNSALRLRDLPVGLAIPSEQGGDVIRANNLSDLTNPVLAVANIGAQPASANLQAFSVATFANESIPYYSGGGFGFIPTSSYSRAVLASTDDNALRNNIGLGSAAVLNAGTGGSNVILGNDIRLSQVPVVNYSVTGPLYGSDTGKVIRYAQVAPVSLTLGSGDFTGYVFTIRVTPGAGAVTIVPATGVGLYKAGGTIPSAFTVASGGLATLLCDAPNGWVISGVGVS